MNALKYITTIKNGQLDLPSLNLPEGTKIEAILLITEPHSMDTTEDLLPTEVNSIHLEEAVKELKN